MTFGLEQHIIDKIISVFEANAKVDKAYVFGSRAKGNYRPDSDIDIAIKGIDIILDDILKMSVAFEDKGIKYKIDLIEYSTIKEPALQEHIDRVGIEFYSRWKDKTLKKAGCSFLSGYAFKSSDYSKVGIPLIKIGNIQNRNVTIDNDGDFVLEKIVNEKTSKYLLSNEDVLISMTGQGSVGRVGKLRIKQGEKALLNQRVGKFICNEISLNIDFLYYTLTSDKYQDLLFNTGSGSGQPNLSPELILETEIPWVEYSEQIAIASILRSLDDKINLLQRQNKTLEQLSETLFRQWFVEDSEALTIHELGKIATVGTGKGLKREEFSENGEFPILGANGEIGRTNKFLTDERMILTGRVGTLGKVYINENKVWISDNVLMIRPIEKIYFYPIYFSLLRIDFENMNVGSTQPLVTQTDLKKVELSLPSQLKLEEFSDICSLYFDKINKNTTQIRTLTQTRDALLPKLISGEVRVEMQ